MKTRESVIFDLQYLVRKAMTYPRGKRKIAVEAEVLQDIIDDLNSVEEMEKRVEELEADKDEADPWQDTTMEHILCYVYRGIGFVVSLCVLIAIYIAIRALISTFRKGEHQLCATQANALMKIILENAA